MLLLLFSSASAIDALSAESIASQSSVGAPGLGQVHDLDASSIVAQTRVGNPALDAPAEPVQPPKEGGGGGAMRVRRRARGGSGIIVRVDRDYVVHEIRARGVATSAAVGSPRARDTRRNDLAGAKSVASVAKVGKPVIGLVDALETAPVEAHASATRPAPGQVHSLGASSVVGSVAETRPKVSTFESLLAEIESLSHQNAAFAARIKRLKADNDALAALLVA